MKKKDSDQPRCCEYCRFASAITLTDDMLCEKKGVVSLDYVCRNFVYDPLKRRPRKPPTLFVPPELSDEDE